MEEVLKYFGDSKLENESSQIEKKKKMSDNTKNIANGMNDNNLKIHPKKKANHLFRPSFFDKDNDLDILQPVQTSSNSNKVEQTPALFIKTVLEPKFSKYGLIKPVDHSVEPVVKIYNIMKEFQKFPQEGFKSNTLNKGFSDETADHESLKSDMIDREFSNEIEELANEETNLPFHLDEEDKHVDNLEGINVAAVKRSGLNNILSTNLQSFSLKNLGSTDSPHNFTNKIAVKNLKKVLAKPSNIYKRSFGTQSTNSEIFDKRSVSGVQSKSRETLDQETPIKLNVVFTVTFFNVRLTDLLEKLYEKPLKFTAPWLEKMTAGNI